MSFSANPTLLVVEDVPELREWFRSLLEARYPNFRWRMAGSAIEFHRAIERERPRMAILDEVLGPGEDLASLLATAKARVIPVALMTGMGSRLGPSHALPDGVLRRIFKPEWSSGEGTEVFLKEIGEVIALTSSYAIG